MRVFCVIVLVIVSTTSEDPPVEVEIPENSAQGTNNIENGPLNSSPENSDYLRRGNGSGKFPGGSGGYPGQGQGQGGYPGGYPNGNYPGGENGGYPSDNYPGGGSGGYPGGGSGGYPGGGSGGYPGGGSGGYPGGGGNNPGGNAGVQCVDEPKCTSFTEIGCRQKEWLWTKCPNLCQTCRCRDTDPNCHRYINRCSDIQVKYACRKSCGACVPNNMGWSQ